MDANPTQHDRAGYDVVVVGGGAAGLSAAVALARSRRSVAVIDAGQPRNAPADGVHNFLSRDGIDPLALQEAGRAEVRHYGGDVVEAKAVAARGAVGDLTVELDDGRTLAARHLLVATGLTDELPDVPGIEPRWGRDVVHCPYCHGWELRDQVIAVLSTSAQTAHQALLFRQLSPHVTVLTHTGPALADDDVAKLTARGIKIVDGEVVALEADDDGLVGARLAGGRLVRCQALTVRPRFMARSAVLASLGLEPVANEAGDEAYAADPMGATDIPGVWVAGNVADPMAGVVAAASAGTAVGSVINAALVEDDVAYAHALAEVPATAPGR